jgi:hypothetical protein
MTPAEELDQFFAVYAAVVPAILPWLERTYFTTFGHGADLVTAISMLSNDAGATAEKFLERAEAAEWLVRQKRAPVAWQCFFGVGGSTGKHMESATIYGWSPRETGLDSPISKWLAKKWPP